jgi:ABC-type uncharacterized transport system auxiliary subunit
LGSRAALALLVLGALLPSCALSNTRPSMHHYQLSADPVPAEHNRKMKVNIGTVVAAGPLDDSAIVYQTSAHQLDSYHFHRWVEPPADMVQRSLNDRFIGGYGLENLPVLDARINSFQEVDKGDQASGLVDIRFCLRADQRTPADESGCWTIRHQTPAGAKNAGAAVDAISASFDQVISDLEDHVRSRLNAMRPRTVVKRKRGSKAAAN